MKHELKRERAGKAGLANIDKRTTMTRILIGLAIVHCAPLIIMVWSRLLLGGE